MPSPCLARICSNKAVRVRTLPAPRRVQPLPHTNAPPRDNGPGLRTVSPAPTAPPVAPAALPWSTTCAPRPHLCSRLRRHRAPWLNEAAPQHFLVLPPSRSIPPPSPDLLPRQTRAHT